MVLISGCVETINFNSPISEQPTTTTISSIATPTPTIIPSPIIFHVGDTVSDGVTNITLNGLRYTTAINEGHSLLQADYGYKYIILDITLEIVQPGEERYYGQGNSFRVVDSEGYIYTNHRAEYEALKRPLASAQNLTYGDKLRGELSFEIPENAVGLRFKFQIHENKWITYKLSNP